MPNKVGINIFTGSVLNSLSGYRVSTGVDPLGPGGPGGPIDPEGPHVPIPLEWVSGTNIHWGEAISENIVYWG